jgi:hypothetical protein
MLSVCMYHFRHSFIRGKDEGTAGEYKHAHVRPKQLISLENYVLLCSSCPGHCCAFVHKDTAAHSYTRTLLCIRTQGHCCAFVHKDIAVHSYTRTLLCIRTQGHCCAFVHKDTAVHSYTRTLAPIFILWFPNFNTRNEISEKYPPKNLSSSTIIQKLVDGVSCYRKFLLSL